jgi:hypothetical protein
MIPSKVVVRAAAVVLAALCVTPNVPRADTTDGAHASVAISLGAGSALWLEGTSTLHAYESRSHEVEIGLERDRAATDPARAADLMQLIRSVGVRGMSVRVPVASLRSKNSGLDKNLRKAMKADQYPEVRFHLDHYQLAPEAANRDTIAIEADGSLTIAGQERQVRLEARAYPGEAGIWLEGSEVVLMSEYGIKPPTMMLGTLRVGDPVTVRYRLLLVPTGEGTRPSADGNR